MPLDNRKLTSDVLEYLIGLPLDDEVWRKTYELAYQTKVSLYDSKCKGCGYMRIEVGDKVFNNIDEALAYSTTSFSEIKRTCCFPDDIIVVHGKEVYPDLTEIVINTCAFWNGDYFAPEPPDCAEPE